MKVFKRDLSAIRRKTLEETATAANTLAKLRAARPAILLDGDLAAVEQHDAVIAGAEARCSILQQKLEVLSAELKAERNDEREADRQAAIKRIAPLLTEREKIAAELEAVIKRMSELWFALAEFQSPIHQHWAFPLQPGFGKFDAAGLNREMSLAMFAAARPVQGQLRMPQAASLDSGVSGRGAEGLGAVVARQNAALLAALQTAPLGRDETEEAA
jgi:hypothetical protein